MLSTTKTWSTSFRAPSIGSRAKKKALLDLPCQHRTIKRIQTMTNSRIPIPFGFAERFPRAFDVEHRLAQQAEYEEMSRSRETDNYLLARQLQKQLDCEAAVQLSHDTSPTSMDPPTTGASDWYEQRNPHQTVRPSTQGVAKDQEVIDAKAYLALYAEADSDTPKAPQVTTAHRHAIQSPKRRCTTSK